MHAIRLTILAAALAAVTAGAQTQGGTQQPPTNLAAPAFRIGQKVQVYYRNWYPATIREIGKGDYAGFYRISFDDFPRTRWVDADEIRAVPPNAKTKAAFLSGTYNCYRRERPGKPLLVDVLFVRPNGEYDMRDDRRKGRYILGADDGIVFRGGGLHDADSHVDGRGRIHVVRTGHKHWSDKDPQQMYCIEETM